MTAVERRKLALETIDLLNTAADGLRALGLSAIALDHLTEILETVWGMWSDEGSSVEQHRDATRLLIGCAERLERLHSALSAANEAA